MGLFSGIFGTPAAAQNTTVPGTKRVFSSGKDTVILSKGEIVKGEIIDLRSNEVTVRLEDGKQLHAKLNSAMELSIGQEAEFYVQETNDVLITLKLLSDGDSSFAESTIDRALEAAGFPKSANAVGIVRSLLTAGLPANKEMIQKMMQYSAANKGVELSTLTALLKHNLPVTKENAAELQAYRNFEHRLLGQAASLTSSLTDALRFGEATPDFAQRLLELFFGNGTESSSAANAADGINPVLAEEADVPVNPETAGITSGTADAADAAVSSALTDIPPANGAPLPDGAVQGQAAPFSAGVQEPAARPDVSGTVSQSSDTTPQPSGTTSQSLVSFEETAPLKNFLSETDYQKLGNALSKLSQDSPEFAKLNLDFTNGTLTANRLFSALSSGALTRSAADTAALFKEEPLFSSLLDKTLLGRFVLTPEDLTKEDAIKKFYEKTRTTLSSLTELANASSDGSASMKNAADTGAKMQDNIQFMNTLNQLFPYVQLPLKLTEQFTHGELYVYTKKKDLSAQDKEVSILLHLDMDSLGPTDIHLSLLRQNVAAKFYLTEQDAQELVSEHLPSLTEALQKKGYTLNAQVMKREKEPDIVKDFLDDGDAVPMKRFRFDIRA
ncbi:MAG: flagellar hook-length control protein FliK [Lachnospiraceae bacterium]|nr:flagellar hook-length control protein FliK [Lachnospiraceae bacterium]